MAAHQHPVNLGHATREVADAAGVTYRIIDYWARTGVLVPSLLEAGGSGSRRRYSHDDMSVAVPLARLTALGLGGVSLRNAAEQLRARITSGQVGVMVYVTPDGDVRSAPPLDGGYTVHLPS